MESEYFEFQQKISLSYPKRAEAIQETGNFISMIELLLTSFMNYSGDRTELLENLTKAQEQILKLEIYFAKHKYFFNEDIETKVKEITSILRSCVVYFSNFRVSKTLENSEEVSKMYFEKGKETLRELFPLKKQILEKEFRKVLSTESPNYIIDKNNG